MTAEEARQVVDRVSEGVVQGLKETLHIPMMAVAFKDKEEGLIDLEEGVKLAEALMHEKRLDAAYVVKDLMSMFIRKTLKDTQADGIIMINDAWVSWQKPRTIGGDDPTKGTYEVVHPREAPDRQEALCVNWEFKTSDRGLVHGFRQYIYHRKTTGIEVDPVIEYAGKTEGRFMNFFS